jgi:hypothetical protein
LGQASPSRDRLIYVLTQLIGHHVDVHVKNGSVISGIFHATNSDKDFGMIHSFVSLILHNSLRIAFRILLGNQNFLNCSDISSPILSIKLLLQE